MKRILLLSLLAVLAEAAFAQKQTFDVTTFSSPKGWVQKEGKDALQLSVQDAAKGTYCLITLYKATGGTINSKENFDLAWVSLVKEMVTVASDPQMQAAGTEGGWETQSGYAPFEHDGTKGIAMLVTATGGETMVNMIMLTNTDSFQKEMTQFLESIELKNVTTTTPPPATQPAAQRAFAFSTTNFDDGWTSTVQEDWVEVTKGNIKVLLHYPKERTTTSSDPDPITNDAWNRLVSERYSNLKNYIVKYVGNYDRVHLAAGSVTDKKSGKEVYVAFIGSNGRGWIEVISPDKNSFVQAFGVDFEQVTWQSDPAIFDPLLRLSNCNKFAVAASDLTDKWTSDFTGIQQLYYVNSGNYAGMNMNQSSETFQFGAGNTYEWNFLAVNGLAGNGKLSQANSSGTFKMINNWQVYFSKIESGPKTYDAYFTCIKGGRLLWMNDAIAKGSGIFTSYGLSK